MAGNSGKSGLTVSGKIAAILVALTTGGEPSLSTLAHHTVYPYRRYTGCSTTRQRRPVVERTAAGDTQQPKYRCAG